MTTAPNRIWLQVEGNEVTWSEDPVNESDIEYVRKGDTEMNTIVAEIVSEGDESVGLFPEVVRVDLAIAGFPSDQEREEVRRALVDLFSYIWADLPTTVTFSDEVDVDDAQRETECISGRMGRLEC